MWVLIISLYAAQPLGHVQSQGIIQAPQPEMPDESDAVYTASQKKCPFHWKK
jgi:hypothetical protein